MESRPKRAARYKIKWLIISEIIVCYMAFLAGVSYLRAPESYVRGAEPIITANNFTSFAGEKNDSEGTLPIVNPNSDQPCGWSAPILLKDTQRISVYIRFSCSEESVGKNLYVDLYDMETGYDNQEQEHVIPIQSVTGDVEFSLERGEIYPGTASIRVFTWDAVDLNVEAIQIKEEIPKQKLPNGMIIGIATCFLILMITLLLYTRSKHKDGREKNSGKSDNA